MKTMIYLDYNATSPLYPEVLQAAEPFYRELFGNPSSLHRKGQEARAQIEKVRRQLLEMLGVSDGELIFTSGGTEADNLAIKGVARSLRSKGNHLVISAIEHSAVLQPVQMLQKEGFEVTLLTPTVEGLITPHQVEAALTGRTILISVMHANNELGSIQPIQDISQFAADREILFHTDAVQSFGKIPVHFDRLGADLMSISAHKIGGPKGVGALVLKRGIVLEPLVHGGPHEHSRRAGTEGTAGIAAMGKAVQITLKKQAEGMPMYLAALRDRLEEGLLDRVSDVHRNGASAKRVPNTSNLSFLNCSGETLMQALDMAGICVSTGAACASASTEPSHVLRALGLSDQRIGGSIRFSLGFDNTEQEIDRCLEIVPEVVERVRKSEKNRV